MRKTGGVIAAILVACTGEDAVTGGRPTGTPSTLPDGGVLSLEITEASALSVPPSKKVSARVVVDRHGLGGPIRITATNAPEDIDLPAIVIPDGASEGMLEAAAHTDSAVRRTKLTIAAEIDGGGRAIRDLDFVVRGLPGTLDVTRSITGSFALPTDPRPPSTVRLSRGPSLARDAVGRLYATSVKETCRITRALPTGETDTSFGSNGTLTVGGAAFGFRQAANDCNAIAVAGDVLIVGGREFDASGKNSRAWVFRASLDGAPAAGFGTQGTAFVENTGSVTFNGDPESALLVLGVGVDASGLPRIAYRTATVADGKTLEVARFSAAGVSSVTALNLGAGLRQGHAVFPGGDARILGQLDDNGQTYPTPTLAAGVLSDGTIDRRFGASGWTVRTQDWNTTRGGEALASAALGPSGRFFWVASLRSFALPASFVATLDVSDQAIAWTAPLGPGAIDYAPSMELIEYRSLTGLVPLPDGDVIALGTTLALSTYTMHFMADGSIDKSWGTDGIAPVPGVPVQSSGNNLGGVAQDDGIVFAVSANATDALLVRVWR